MCVCARAGSCVSGSAFECAFLVDVANGQGDDGYADLDNNNNKKEFLIAISIRFFIFFWELQFSWIPNV